MSVHGKKQKKRQNSYVKATESGRKMMEKENPERLWRIKRNRQKRVIEQNLLKYENTDFEKDLKSKERVIKKSMKVRKNGL